MGVNSDYFIFLSFSAYFGVCFGKEYCWWPILIFQFQTCARCLKPDSCESRGLEDSIVLLIKVILILNLNLINFFQKKDNVGEEGHHTQGPLRGKNLSILQCSLSRSLT